MACLRKRRGKWVVDYRDPAGKRRWVTCETRREAEAVLEEKLRETRQSTRPVVDPDITVQAYGARWLGLIGPTVKPRTLEAYRHILTRHVLPAFGAIKVRRVAKGTLRGFLAEKLRGGLSRKTVALIHGVLRLLLGAAVDDGVILANPADRLSRQLRLTQAAAARQEEIKALTREQLIKFLAAAEETEHGFYPLLVLLARTGMRLGEALALQWQDVDFGGREIRVCRNISARRIDTPKSGHGRTVDMSHQLASVLRRLHVERKAETLRRGGPEVPPWVSCSKAGTPLEPARVQKAFKRSLTAAGLPLHFSPHCLRHTFASLLLQQGESPVYVQRQLGHASIKLTVDTYGKWLPMGNKAAVDRLDEAEGPARGSRMVAAAHAVGRARPEVADSLRVSLAPSAQALQEHARRRLTFRSQTSRWRIRDDVKSTAMTSAIRTSSTVDAAG